jgi:hypothetical protein
VVDLGELAGGAGEADLESFGVAGPALCSAPLIRAIRLSRISVMRGR